MTTDNELGKGAWSPRASAELYRLDGWSGGFFAVGESGRLQVRPLRNEKTQIDLYEVVTGLEERGLSAPLMIGFPDILQQRMADMTEAFRSAIEENEYRGDYTGVYPVKVNQHRYLVGQVENLGRRYGYGIEVGSKPELLAIMGLTSETPDRLIICNGFKEEWYVNHIMLATKLGRRVIAVIENSLELDIILAKARAMGVRPHIGVRLKMDIQSSGRWRASTGEKAKFGLNAAGVIEVVNTLRAAGMLDCLELVHCHMGSQLSDIRVVNIGVNQLARTYVELRRLGANVHYIDVGGGLGIDYDGSQTDWDFSINYGLSEYASNVVYRLMSVCNEADMPHPTIVTESGRALVGYHSVLVCNVLGSNRLDRWSREDLEAAIAACGDQPPRVLDDILATHEAVSDDNLIESYHDAQQAREEALTLFNVGHLSLEVRSLIDRLFWTICFEVSRRAAALDPMPEELDELKKKISDTYFCNLSVFQSLPDSWAIDQVFPIMPIHRLDEQPTRHGTLADITCDSDGKIERFVDRFDVADVLPLHSLRDGEPYYLGIFLVGAYQETLGDLHNLFGDSHLVHIRFDEEEGWYVDEVVEGDSVSEVLSYLEYDPRELSRSIRRECETLIREKRLTAAEGHALLKAYEAGLAGYTYLEGEE